MPPCPQDTHNGIRSLDAFVEHHGSLTAILLDQLDGDRNPHRRVCRNSRSLLQQPFQAIFLAFGHSALSHTARNRARKLAVFIFFVAEQIDMDVDQRERGDDPVLCRLAIGVLVNDRAELRRDVGCETLIIFTFRRGREAECRSEIPFHRLGIRRGTGAMALIHNRTRRSLVKPAVNLRAVLMTATMMGSSPFGRSWPLSRPI